MNVPNNLGDIVIEAHAAAKNAGYAFLDKHFEGRDGGACGFGWVLIFDEKGGKIRKNSKLGQALEDWGIKKNWEGIYQVWRPGAMHCQSVDAQLEAAYAYADVFKKHGFQAFAQSRLD